MIKLQPIESIQDSGMAFLNFHYYIMVLCFHPQVVSAGLINEDLNAMLTVVGFWIKAKKGP